MKKHWLVSLVFVFTLFISLLGLGFNTASADFCAPGDKWHHLIEGLRCDSASTTEVVECSSTSHIYHPDTGKRCTAWAGSSSSISASPSRLLSVQTPFLRGEDVKIVQEILRNKGYNLVGDGIYGNYTAHIVSQFQAKYNLPVTGNVDAATLAELNSAGAYSSASSSGPSPVSVNTGSLAIDLNSVKTKAGLGYIVEYKVTFDGSKYDPTAITLEISCSSQSVTWASYGGRTNTCTRTSSTEIINMQKFKDGEYRANPIVFNNPTSQSQSIVASAKAWAGNKMLTAKNDTTTLPSEIVASPSITVTSPNGGESFTAGSTLNGSFSSLGLPVGATYEVALVGSGYDTEIGYGLISSNSRDKQPISVIIPSNVPPRSNYYRVRLAVCNSDLSNPIPNITRGNCVQDQSDRNFTITAPSPTPSPTVQPSITVTSPNGGETFIMGNSLQTAGTIRVQWRSQGLKELPEKAIGVALRRTGDGNICPIATTSSYHDSVLIGVYEGFDCRWWQSSSNWGILSPGTYKIYVWLIGSDVIIDDNSNNYFTITASTSTPTATSSSIPVPTPTITSISPTSGAAGTYVALDGSGFSSSGNVVYFRSGSVYNTVYPSAQNTAKIIFLSPSLASGTWDVSVKNSSGIESNRKQFTIPSTITSSDTATAAAASVSRSITVTGPLNSYGGPTVAAVTFDSSGISRVKIEACVNKTSCTTLASNVSVSSSSTRWVWNISGTESFAGAQGEKQVWLKVTDLDSSTSAFAPSYIYIIAAPSSSSSPSARINPVSLSASAINAASAPFRFTQFLEEDSYGTEVKELQKRLSNVGYYAGNIDGIFGSQLKEAVIRFQTDNKLKADGIVGYEMRTFLNR